MSLTAFPLTTVSAAPAQPTVTAQQRIDQLLNLFPDGSYFTVNGKPCTHGRYDTCSNCKMSNVMTQRLGYSQSQVSGIIDGWTCVGWARFAFYYLWGVKDNVGGGNAPAGSYRVNINQAKPGDIIRLYSDGRHWGIFVRNDNDYVYLLDANGSGGIAQVRYGVNRYLKSNVSSVIRANDNTDTPTPQPQPAYKTYTIQASSGANVRNTAAGTQIVGAIAKGSVVRYTQTVVANGYVWMLIETGSVFASGSWGSTIGYWVAQV